MTENRRRSPKELFMAYDCSPFHMLREGVYDEYKSHQVSADQEAEWRQEFRNHLLSDLLADPRDGHIANRYFSTLDLPREEESLDPLMSTLDQKKDDMDAFSRILYSETISEILGKYRLARTRVKVLRGLATDLVEKAMSNPSKIDPRFKQRGYLEGLLDKNVITERARKTLKALE